MSLITLRERERQGRFRLSRDDEDLLHEQMAEYMGSEFTIEAEWDASNSSGRTYVAKIDEERRVITIVFGNEAIDLALDRGGGGRGSFGWLARYRKGTLSSYEILEALKDLLDNYTQTVDFRGRITTPLNSPVVYLDGTNLEWTLQLDEDTFERIRTSTGFADYLGENKRGRQLTFITAQLKEVKPEEVQLYRPASSSSTTTTSTTAKEEVKKAVAYGQEEKVQRRKKKPFKKMDTLELGF